MPKGSAKKGKKGKLAKMTEEQRILFMEQKLLAEEEMRRKKEEMLTQFLKDKLLKEEKSTKFNLTKLQNQWRVIMREGIYIYALFIFTPLCMLCMHVCCMYVWAHGRVVRMATF